jgi:hypothetical protein
MFWQAGLRVAPCAKRASRPTPSNTANLSPAVYSGVKPAEPRGDYNFLPCTCVPTTSPGRSSPSTPAKSTRWCGFYAQSLLHQDGLQALPVPPGLLPLHRAQRGDQESQTHPPARPSKTRAQSLLSCRACQPLPECCHRVSSKPDASREQRGDGRQETRAPGDEAEDCDRQSPLSDPSQAIQGSLGSNPRSRSFCSSLSRRARSASARARSSSARDRSWSARTHSRSARSTIRSG